MKDGPKSGMSGSWPDRRLLDLLKIEIPILQAPMACANGSDLAVAVSEAGGLGALPCAMLSPERIREEVTSIRNRTDHPFAVNFFCHRPPQVDIVREIAWKERLLPYYQELGLDPDAVTGGGSRRPFDEEACALVEELRPPVVSFHFGLPDSALLRRVRATGAKILSSATTVREAVWLEERGCDAVIAQGFEAGGHRGMFLADDVATQVGTMALVPQIVDAVRVPVVAAGGIADARGIVASFALGASGALIGTAYLFCPEVTISETHRLALRQATDDGTVLTNVFSGRPARGIVNRLVQELGPISGEAPEFPQASVAIAPLRSASEAAGSFDFAQMWSGQSASLGREVPAGDLTRQLAQDSLEKMSKLAKGA